MNSLLETPDVRGLVIDLEKKMSLKQLAEELGMPEAELRQPILDRSKILKLMRSITRHGFFDLLPAHGVQPTPYDLETPFQLTAAPLGYDIDPPIVPLIKRPTKIAGFPVDYPLGLPASVLAANAKWLEFYARRGFDILTYKTVRSVSRAAHPWPNWVFLKDPQNIVDVRTAKFIGEPYFTPDELSMVSMGNSFGVPSFEPDWWMEDVRRARSIIRDGHQVLIVSVVASVTSSAEAIAEDFVKTALMAKKAGADIIEANYSCPNTPGDPCGEVYKSAKISKKISEALKQALGNTPLFVKIGYLEKQELNEFVTENVKHIDGIVAINTISAEIRTSDDKQTFPGPGRLTAGVSGWAIKERAQEVARHLVEFCGKVKGAQGGPLTILAIGGVTTPKDVSDYLNIGVHGVESCTGAFLNPNLGLELRYDAEADKQWKKPNRVAFELEILREFIGDLVRRPTKASRIRADRASRRVVVEPVLEP